MSNLSSFSMLVGLHCECSAAGNTPISDSSSVGCNCAQIDLNEASSHEDIFIVSAASVQLSIDRQISLDEEHGVMFVAILIPSTFLDSSLDRQRKDGLEWRKMLKGGRDKSDRVMRKDAKLLASQRTDTCQSIEWMRKQSRRKKFTHDILSQIHKFLVGGVVRGVISLLGTGCAPADVLLLDVPKSADASSSLKCIIDILDVMNGEGMVADPGMVIKALPISKLTFTEISGNDSDKVASLRHRLDIPSCPVCLHRIDPSRIGLPKPKNHHLCSKFCSTTNLVAGQLAESCINQRFLSPWPPPAYCEACHVIHDYWNIAGHGKVSSATAAASDDFGEASAVAFQDLLTTGKTPRDGPMELFCNRCGMQETLWVCLSCGFVGCGRYSNKHAEEHYQESGHPYSLELVTTRIWDYANGEFAHRGDLLECPSVQRKHPWVGRPGASRQLGLVASRDSVDDDGQQHGGFESQDYILPVPNQHIYALSDETSPKKANMIGEEYEALLQSALEDQAQHYEGEISRLRAALMAEQIDEGSTTNDEMKEIECLNADISKYRAEIDRLQRQLVDAQAQEAGHRAASQRLLREQAVAKDLLDKIREEASMEHEQGKMQVEELEQQVADLTANLRMRHQFSQDQELSNAQIFGTASSNKKQTKRGKKLRRLFRP